MSRPTAPEVAALIQRLGLSNPKAARLLGVTPRAVQFWASGERPIDEPAVRLLRLAADVPEARVWLEREASR